MIININLRLFTERREQPSPGEMQMKNKAITRKMSLLILRKKYLKKNNKTYQN